MKQTAPLSKSQYGIYVECMNHVGEIYYNTAFVFRLDGSLDGQKLCKAVEATVMAHPALFTRIALNDDNEPVQSVGLSEETWSLDVEPVEDIDQALSGLIQPFDLHKDRLFRIRLFKDAEYFHLFVDIHHIVNDGTSQAIFLQDIETAYNGEPIAPECITLCEQATEEVGLRATAEFEEGKQWYARNFDCADTFTGLTPDLEEEGREEGTLRRTLAVNLEAVDAFCKEHGIFKSNFFTMAYAFLLAKYNNEQESFFTTVYNGRSDKRLARTIGMFVKSVPVFTKFTSDTSVMELLRNGQEQMGGCRKHEAYSFVDFMQDIAPQYDNMFAWHGELFDNEQMMGKPMKRTWLMDSPLDIQLYLKAFIENGKCQIVAEYNAKAYSQELVCQFMESYEAVVNGFLWQEFLRDISIVTESQTTVLDSFNRTDCEYDDTQTIVSLFRRQAEATPDNVALIYKDKRFTYSQIDEISDRIAARIASMGLGAEDVVSILIPRCEWMGIIPMGVLKAGCAYQPLDPTYPKERLNFMMKDAGVSLLIADEGLRPLADEFQGETLFTGELMDLPRAEVQPVAPSPSSLFILLYTSGSTGIPKGCQLEHGNLVAFCHWYQSYYGLHAGDKVAAYASFGFDASMMDMYPALTCGATVCIIPEEIRLDLMALNEYLEQNGVTHSFMTTQVGYQFATSIENRSLRHLSTGGEKLVSLAPPQEYNFYNVYGPTETTILVTAYRITQKLKEIPIGKPLDNMKLYIVDNHGHRLPVGAAGELWISGPQVSRGYLNRPEKTQEVYIANPFTDNEKYARIYRSGDVVRYLPSGDIQFVGRRDGQVKIRGFRIELKEVEGIIREFPGIKDATVQAFDEEGGGKFIAAYIVSDEQIDIEALNRFILEEKPPYMVPAVTMQIDSIPLNQNQKVNKRVLPKPEKKPVSVEEGNVPMNVLETELHQLIAAIVNHENFGVTTVLGYAGLTSITAIKLAVQINKRYGVVVDAKSLVKNGTLQSIENEILRKMLHDASADGRQEEAVKKEIVTSAPLSYAQTGVYFECMKNPFSTVYNIPCLLTYPSGTDACQLADAVKTVIHAHTAMNIRFETQGEGVRQYLDADLAIQVPVKAMTEEELTLYKEEFVRPFNLQKAPLWRFEVIETPSAVHLLMDVHHLIFDGGSVDLFIRQVSEALEGQTVSKETYTFLDFVHDQMQAEQTESFRKAEKFFAEKLQACEGASEVPADLQKTDKESRIGEACSPVNHEEVARFCRSHDITPAHLFYAAVTYVVSRYTNNRDVYLCTVSGGRSNLKVSETVGMFVNTLALGLSVDDVTVEDFLQTASRTFTETLENENYPFARIASDYGFQPAIAYAYQVGVLSAYSLKGQSIGQEVLELDVPKFKINIQIQSQGVVVEYDDALYSRSVGEALAESIVAVVERMMQMPSERIRSLSIVSRKQATALDKVRTTGSGESPFRLFHECIHHYAVVAPDREALVACDATFTYAEMDELTDRIASGLRARGVLPRDRVALLLPRSSRLILSLFGVLKAEASYIPCDPEYPADRVKYILEDSGSAYIITDGNHAKGLPKDKVIDVEGLVKHPIERWAPSITSDDLAYIIYTSGSTGKPKGVMLRHEGICNYLTAHPANVLAHAVQADTERILSVTTISFDAALQDIGTAFFNGKTLVLATEEQANNPIELARLISGQRIDMVSGTPSRWLTWLTSGDFAEAIRYIRIARAGGEKFSGQLLELLKAKTSARIFNCYGPTETTVASNNKELTHAVSVTVGKPQLNVKEFVVDQDGNELPVGVVGELYIGGRGVARGYNNLDDMTRERFIAYQGERVYKSGDYAKWNADGDIVILGRTDNQIKLRGLRIELGEIENVMLKVEGLEKVVILIRKLNDKEHLCAYYTADRPIAPDALKAEISKSLTQYMVPTAYLQVDKMPMTPSGKTDVKALPEPVLAVSSAYEAPANPTEHIFCDIFASVLQIDKVGATDNFFESGGTSLVVTRVIIEADKAGLRITYGDVFAHPTPRQLARLVNGDKETDGQDEVADYDYGIINSLLKSNTLEAFKKGERLSLGNVLLTGATGYLGIHILKELIGSDIAHIYCLVRDKNLEAAERRLKTLLFYYHDDEFSSLFGNRIHLVLGDVTQTIDETLPVDTVFNCAAVVKHFSEGTFIEDVNIGGAQHCVDFCLKKNARLVHISTASTRGLSVNGIPDSQEVFTEQKLYMGQYLGNKYIYSKFMAERLILEAIATQGLSAKIMRVGNLAARSTDGEFQINFLTNSFMGRIKVYNMLGCCPHEMRTSRVEFSPINEVSKAILLLASTPKECCVFHPFNIHTQFLGDVLEVLKSVTGGIDFVEMEQFEEVMEKAKSDPTKAKILSSLLAYQDMAHGQKTSDVNRDNSYTTQVLFRLGFNWSATSWDYIERMLHAICGLGFFDI